MQRRVARAPVFMVMASMTASTGVAAAEPNNGPVTAGETFQIWPRNPQQASVNWWQAAQDHNTAVKPDYDGIVDALNRLEQYNSDMLPI